MIYYYGKAHKKDKDKVKQGQVVACEVEQPRQKEQEAIWRLLWESIPMRQPLEGQEAYEFLEGDLSILVHTTEQNMLRNNSFLLHGYHNYGYLLLARQDDIHYIAVPGNYYAREKAVAVIFGFEYFDCGIVEQVPNGAFGYYFKKVILCEKEKN